MYKKLLLSVIIAISYNTTTITSDPSVFATYIQPCAAAIWNAANPTFSLGLAYALGTLHEQKSFHKDDLFHLGKRLALVSFCSAILNKLTAAGGKWLNNKDCIRKPVAPNKAAELQCEVTKQGLCKSVHQSMLNALGGHLYNHASEYALAATIGAMYGYSRLSQ